MMTYSIIKAKANHANWAECPCDIALSKFCVSFDLNNILSLLLPLGSQKHLKINSKNSRREKTAIKNDNIVLRLKLSTFHTIIAVIRNDKKVMLSMFFRLITFSVLVITHHKPY